MFKIEFTEKAVAHLEAFSRFARNIILDAIKSQLRDQPAEETRNKKPLRANPVADWELRVQKYRVFYEVLPERRLVKVVAIGYKDHNRLFIDGEEVLL